MKRYIFMICALVILSSCDRYTGYRSKSFVLRYDDLAAITLSKYRSVPCISVNNDLTRSRFWCGPFREEGLYDSLCDKYGDTEYNEKVYYLVTFEEPSRNASDLLSVKVYSDRDFDAEHPAGSSLADIIRFLSCSPKEYIASGYKSLYRYDPELVSPGFRSTWGYYYGRPDKEKSEYYPVDKMLCDIVPEDLMLLGPDVAYNPQRAHMKFFSLFFEKLPVVKDSHVITVEVTTDDGRVLSGSIVMDFAE